MSLPPQAQGYMRDTLGCAYPEGLAPSDSCAPRGALSAESTGPLFWGVAEEFFTCGEENHLRLQKKRILHLRPGSKNSLPAAEEDGIDRPALTSNGSLGQPTMGGTAELSWRHIEVGPNHELPRGAHDATAGGTIVERRPNGPFEVNANPNPNPTATSTSTSTSTTQRPARKKSEHIALESRGDFE